MTDTDLQILEMYYGGMDAEVIADELRLSVATVKEVIKAFEDGEYKTR
jgi:DNA-binding NarL/FixJ family response regulator